MSAFKPLDALTAADLPRVGGKAWNCARLKQAGFPVPDALVVPVDATDDEILRIGGHPWLAAVPADARFAVRSSGLGEDSAAHSFAGINETLLDVARDRVADAVLECRRSPYSEQARAYRAARHLSDDDARIGIMVQQMVAATTSGVAFTINPVDGADEIIINAASGLGEALVSGRVAATEYRLTKSGTAPAPDDTINQIDLVALRGLLLRIERLYGEPQDVEWCHDGRRFWIVQSRPVTAAALAPADARGSTSSPRAFQTPGRTFAGGADPEWTRANVVEVLPEQMSTQTLFAFEAMLNRAQRLLMGRLLAPESDLGPMFKPFHGRLYMNLSQMRRVAALMRAPAADVLRSLGHPEAIRPDDEKPEPWPAAEFLRALPDLIRIASYDARAETLVRRHEARTRATIERITKTDPRSLADREIWSMVTWWVEDAPVAIQIVFVVGGVLGRETLLRRVCEKVGFSYERLVYPHLAAGQRSVSSRQAFDLVALADLARREPAARDYLLSQDGSFPGFRQALAGTTFLARFEQFLDAYGHRGHYESDWALPRLHENPAPALFAIRQRLDADPQDESAIAARQEAEAGAARREFAARLTWWQRLTLLPMVRSVLRRLKKQYVWREQVRSDLTRILRYGREYHLTLADRFVERGWLARRDDYFLLRLDEVGAAIEDPARGPALRDIAARRAAERAAERDLIMPLFMRESELPALLGRRYQQASRNGDALTGLCVSPGAVEAEVVVMHDPSEFAAMKRGAILVTTATDPSWTPLFTLASGVVVEVGGMLSHASTIAREYGLPALANVKDATRRLKTGDRVRLDASAGRVEIARPSTGSGRA